MKATNTKDAPETLAPTPLEGVSVEGGKLMARLRPGSWNAIVLSLDRARA